MPLRVSRPSTREKRATESTLKIARGSSSSIQSNIMIRAYMGRNYLRLGKEILKKVRNNSTQIPHGARISGIK